MKSYTVCCPENQELVLLKVNKLKEKAMNSKTQQSQEICVAKCESMSLMCSARVSACLTAANDIIRNAPLVLWTLPGKNHTVVWPGSIPHHKSLSYSHNFSLIIIMRCFFCTEGLAQQFQCIMHKEASGLHTSLANSSPVYMHVVIENSVPLPFLSSVMNSIRSTLPNS